MPQIYRFSFIFVQKQYYMKYKLIVLDLDGTLTNSKKEITPRNKETLIRIQEKGVRLVLASGRPTYGIVPLANELRMNKFGGFILSYNGGEIINWESGEMIYENVLPNEIVPVLYESARTSQLAILTYDGADIVTEHSTDPYVQKEAFLNKMNIRETNDFLTDITLPVAKCLIVGDADKLMPLEAELSLRLQGQINIFRSEPYFLELVPQGIDKALSLEVLLKEIGVKREEVIAMGDGYNDLSMIQFAGLGIAMGNAQEPVKKAADYITLSNEEDGVAEAIDKFFTNENDG
ncbi:haloacid dehalogenase-like hydrolase [gut metagenome]|uniref:Haloacid dehalogenase-like hydrolase n=1 Tax=gut metagenome TaxID=749906 RepID=J9GRK3_9ZZZZ